MGCKGVSKHKPKKSKSGGNDYSIYGSSNPRLGESPSSAQALVNTKYAPLRKEGTSPSAGSNKTEKGGQTEPVFKIKREHPCAKFISSCSSHTGKMTNWMF